MKLLMFGLGFVAGAVAAGYALFNTGCECGCGCCNCGKEEDEHQCEGCHCGCDGKEVEEEEVPHVCECECEECDGVCECGKVCQCVCHVEGEYEEFEGCGDCGYEMDEGVVDALEITDEDGDGVADWVIIDDNDK